VVSAVLPELFSKPRTAVAVELSIAYVKASAIGCTMLATVFPSSPLPDGGASVIDTAVPYAAFAVAEPVAGVSAAAGTVLTATPSATTETAVSVVRANLVITVPPGCAGRW
jgi:hypothetical protein